MNKKTSFTILFFILLNTVLAQTYTIKDTISEKEKVDLFRELFDFNAEVGYYLSSNDPAISFSDMRGEEQYDEAYFQKQKTHLQSDSLNPIANNNLGSYYNFFGKSDSAIYYFKKSYDNLSIKYFNKDSAYYLSFRGALKLNLGIEKYIEDFEHSLLLNRDDSVALTFYPLILLHNKDYKKAKALFVSHLDTDTASVLYPYLLLITAEIFDGFFSFQNEISANEKLKMTFAEKEYTELFNFKLIDKYANKFKSNSAIKNTRYMADVFALVTKAAYFGKKNGEEYILATLTANEKKKLINLENVFMKLMEQKQINSYAANKNLGYINLILQNWDKAIAYFNKAIGFFPQSKRFNTFSSSEMYDALTVIYYLNKDNAGIRKTLKQKIEAQPDGKKNVKDFLQLATSYYRSDEVKDAEQWANEAKLIDQKNFEVLLLLTHLNYLNKNIVLAEFYFNEAAKSIQSNEQQYKLAILNSIYLLIMGDATSAYDYIKIARQSLENEPCTFCDTLIDKYIKVN